MKILRHKSLSKNTTEDLCKKSITHISIENIEMSEKESITLYFVGKATFYYNKKQVLIREKYR
jgi:hypothetical protein